MFCPVVSEQCNVLILMVLVIAPLFDNPWEQGSQHAFGMHACMHAKSMLDLKQGSLAHGIPPTAADQQGCWGAAHSISRIGFFLQPQVCACLHVCVAKKTARRSWHTSHCC